MFDRKAKKIAARYQQVFGTRRMVARIKERRADGGREGGVIWRTTGSGKSFSMLFLCKALLFHSDLASCRVLVVTDRKDLEKQLFGTFISGGAFGGVIEDFYEALTEFGMCLKLALESPSFFEDPSCPEDLISRYKADLKFFTDLRRTARRDAQEIIDFSKYEGQISRLVDQHVVGEEIKSGDAFIVVDELGASDDPDSWSKEKARTETDLIKTRLSKRIEELVDDPFARQVFSELLRKKIQEAEALFDYPNKQYLLFKELDSKVQRRDTPSVPDRFGDNHRAKAYYGAFRLALGDEAFARFDEERYVEEALHVDQVVSDAIALHSINPQNIESEVRKELLKRYYDMFGGLEMAKTVIEQMVEIVRYGAAARAG